MKDQNREVVATYEYDAWGNVSKEVIERYRIDNHLDTAGYHVMIKRLGMYYLMRDTSNRTWCVFIGGSWIQVIRWSGDAAWNTYGDIIAVMMVDPDGHWAYRPLGNANCGFMNKRTALCNDRAVRAGIKGWAESYSFNLMGGGNFVSKWDHLSGTHLKGGNNLKQNQRSKCSTRHSSIKVGNRKRV